MSCSVSECSKHIIGPPTLIRAGEVIIGDIDGSVDTDVSDAYTNGGDNDVEIDDTVGDAGDADGVRGADDEHDVDVDVLCADGCDDNADDVDVDDDNDNDGDSNDDSDVCDDSSPGDVKDDDGVEAENVDRSANDDDAVCAKGGANDDGNDASAEGDGTNDMNDEGKGNGACAHDDDDDDDDCDDGADDDGADDDADEKDDEMSCSASKCSKHIIGSSTLIRAAEVIIGNIDGSVDSDVSEAYTKGGDNDAEIDDTIGDVGDADGVSGADDEHDVDVDVLCADGCDDNADDVDVDDDNDNDGDSNDVCDSFDNAGITAVNAPDVVDGVEVAGVAAASGTGGVGASSSRKERVNDCDCSGSKEECIVESLMAFETAIAAVLNDMFLSMALVDVS